MHSSVTKLGIEIEAAWPAQLKNARKWIDEKSAQAQGGKMSVADWLSEVLKLKIPYGQGNGT